MEYFQNDVETVLSYLRYIRSDAISNRVIGDTTPEGGFGLHLEHITNTGESHVQLTYFVDDNDASGSGIKDGEYSPGNDTELDQKTIPAFWKFTFENVSPSSVPITDTLTTIFIPPNADMSMNDGDVANDIRSVELVFQHKNVKKRICLNRVSRFFEVISGNSCS
jgi:hypothetical protein